jgi:hypothetical protein
MKPYPNFRDLESCHGVTWHDLVDLEPALAELLWQARQAGVACACWSDVDRVFAPFRDALTQLVGFARQSRWHPVLGGVGAFEIAYWKLYDAVAGLLPLPAGASELDPEKHPGETATEMGLTPTAAA